MLKHLRYDPFAGGHILTCEEKKEDSLYVASMVDSDEEGRYIEDEQLRDLYGRLMAEAPRMFQFVRDAADDAVPREILRPLAMQLLQHIHPEDSQLSGSGWVDARTIRPPERIRVLAADDLSVIGDCFLGFASAPGRWSEDAGARIPIPRWDEVLWRYSHNENPCRNEPTRWMPLPRL